MREARLKKQAVSVLGEKGGNVHWPRRRGTPAPVARTTPARRCLGQDTNQQHAAETLARAQRCSSAAVVTATAVTPAWKPRATCTP